MIASLPTRVAAHELAGNLANVVVLDVRSPAEFASEHIPGSVNLPLDHLPEHAAILRDAVAAPVVLVCRSGARAQQAEQTLQAKGCTSLHVLDGGVGAWEAAGQLLIRGRQRWSMERQVRGAAGALVLVGALGGLFVAPAIGWVAVGGGGGLVFSAVSNTCGMARLLALLPYNKGQSCDVQQAVASLVAARGRAVGAAQASD
jgi:rhodanese-related sulfurtransferase